MSKKNCWEYKRCGREPGGAKAAELGICPAAVRTEVDGIHGGRNGGRSCWVIAGTFCDGRVQGTYASKLVDCIGCDFYQVVGDEEAGDRVDSLEIMAKLK